MYWKHHAVHDFSKAPIVSKYYGGGGAGGAGAEDDEEEAHDELWGVNAAGVSWAETWPLVAPKTMSRLGEKLLARLAKKGEAILAWMAWQFMPRPRLDIHFLI